VKDVNEHDRDSDAFAALRRAGRRVALLEPSTVVAGEGRFPSAWKELDAVVLRLDTKDSAETSDLLRGIAIHWRSLGIDGTMYLVVTDEQMFVRSGHDNPHENHLYWLAPVSPAQRAAVKKVLAARRPGSKIDCGRPEVNGRTSHSASAGEDCFFRAPHAEKLVFGDDHLPITAKNVAALVTELNDALPKDTSALPVPAPADLERRVLISTTVDEIRDWLHVR
jgi:hypothetical protein